jgi:hypothetical protein
MQMSEYLELSLDLGVGLLAKQINKDISMPVIEKFKEGLRSSKKVNHRYFSADKIELRADNLIQAYNMGCYTRDRLGDASRLLLELLL